MAFDYSRYDEKIKKFNKKYGVNFNVRAFHKQAKAYYELNYKTGYDKVYRMTFLHLYQKAVNRYIDNRIPACKASDMLLEFDEIMHDFKKDCDAKKIETNLHVFGNWDACRTFKNLNAKVLAKLQEDRVELNRQRYLNGDLRIRDMLSDTKAVLAKKDEIGGSSLSTLLGYAEALKQINGTRSFFWRTLHPVRNGAEQRASARIVATVKEKVGNRKDLFLQADRNKSEKHLAVLAMKRDMQLDIEKADDIDRMAVRQTRKTEETDRVL